MGAQLPPVSGHEAPLPNTCPIDGTWERQRLVFRRQNKPEATRGGGRELGSCWWGLHAQ